MHIRFQLSLLGTFRLERLDDGSPVPLELPTRKDKSLLTYLALFPGPHPREQLATLLWGDTSDKNARRSLRQALSDLRKVLGDDAVLADWECVQLNPTLALAVDVQTLQARLDALKSDTAGTSPPAFDPAIPVAELLPDFYDEWLLPVRTALQTRRIEAMLSAAARARTRQHYAQALQWAQTVLQVDPANEPAHQLVMSSYLALGDTAAALRQYEVCRQALRHALDAEPSHETKLWYETLRRTGTTKTLVAQCTNLPQPLTSFVGREGELDDLRRCLLKVRLLSLTGSGGAGKTRLAIELGHAQVERYPDGVWWVELAPLVDGNLIPQQVAKALGVQENPQEPLLETLVYFLRVRQLLLVLDNCEHLLEACAEFIATLLERCPALTVLTTSREGLNLAGEQVYAVSPLGIPRVRIDALADLALAYPAVRLFVERAQLAQSKFDLTDANALAVVQICQRLDGMPLAIELAAARIKELSAADLAARLAGSFELLVGTRHTQPRQLTLRALIDWSYNLLTDEEQTLFRRLSVFAGGWTLETMEGVLANVTEGGVSDRSLSLTRLLAALVDKSLVVADITADETRYTLLETVREYAYEKLAEADETAVMQERHAAYFVQFAERGEQEIKGLTIKNAFRRLEREHNNLSAALRWALANDVSNTGLRLTGALMRFWIVSSHLAEGYEWSEKMLTAAGEHDTFTYARGLESAGGMAWANDEFEHSILRYTQALALFRTLDAPAETAFTLASLGTQWFLMGDFTQALPFMQEAEQIARRSRNNWELCWALEQAGITWIYAGEPARAKAALTEALEIARAHGFLQLIGTNQEFLGYVAVQQESYAQADACFQEAMAIADEIQDEMQIGWARKGLALSLLKRGELERAQVLFAEILKQGIRTGRRNTIFYALDGWGVCTAGLAPAPWVARLLGAAATLLAQIKFARDPLSESGYVRAVAHLRALFGDAVVEQEIAVGQTLTLEQALALVKTDP